MFSVVTAQHTPVIHGKNWRAVGPWWSAHDISIGEREREREERNCFFDAEIHRGSSRFLTLFLWVCSSALPLTAGICQVEDFPLRDLWSGRLQDGGKRRKSIKRRKYESHWD